jgi:hypothetical protein
MTTCVWYRFWKKIHSQFTPIDLISREWFLSGWLDVGLPGSHLRMYMYTWRWTIPRNNQTRASKHCSIGNQSIMQLRTSETQMVHFFVTIALSFVEYVGVKRRTRCVASGKIAWLFLSVFEMASKNPELASKDTTCTVVQGRVGRQFLRSRMDWYWLHDVIHPLVIR